MGRTNWKQEIMEEMSRQDERWPSVIACTLSTDELEYTFNRGFGGSEGRPFTLWTKGRVYFPVVYDGAEWAASVPRWPTMAKTNHVGGE